MMVWVDVSFPCRSAFPFIARLACEGLDHRSFDLMGLLLMFTLPFTDGFFDAGMLLQALKASQEEGNKPSEKAIGNARRNVGKKLRLSEY